MANFLIQCPCCGTFNKASTSLFAKKNIKCSCGNIINVKKDKLKSVRCQHCQNIVVYDQSKGFNAECPVCHEKIISEGSISKTVDVTCPTCFCTLTVSKSLTTCECPLCDTIVDVQKEMAKNKMQEEGAISVIKYEGPNDVFVWKHPVENFNLGSQLIVHESQVAVFFKDGQALDTFKAGRYTLSTDSLPLLSKLYQIPTGGKDPFYSEIYFVNLTTQLGIKWGTDSKVRMFDPISGLHIELGACGQFNICVSDARRLLIKVVGTTTGLTQNEIFSGDASIAGMTGKFKALIINKVKTNLAKSIRENDINILEVDEHLDELSEILKNKINEVLVEYGLMMPEFFITSIVTPDDDPNFRKLKEQHAERYLLVQQERIRQAEAEAAQARKLVEARTQAQEEIIAAQASAEAYRLQAEAEAQEMRMKGYTYEQETKRQIGVAMASNESGGTAAASSIVNNMVGLGVGLGVMGEVAGTVRESLSPESQPQTQSWECPSCHTKVTTGFCPNCGIKKPSEGWNCECGQKNITTAFCPNCGSKKPSEGWNCECGQKNITTAFCPNCGSKKPSEGWNCECGQKNIKTNFCPSCGSKKPAE